MSEYVFFVTCPKGVEYLLSDELKSLGMQPFRNAPAGVWARGDLAAGYRVCLWSRLANRVVLQLAEVGADTDENLYAGVKGLDWPSHIPANGRFRVSFLGQNRFIRNTQFGAQRVKDGIVDAFRAAGLPRPSVDTREPDVTVSARLSRNHLSLGIDLSGHSLHMRGYRTDKGIAPLKENLAAALLLRAGWPEIAAEGGDFVDPMCGSGTLLIEAAMMLLDIAPGRRQEHFGFERWPGHEPEIWLALRQEAERRAHAGRQRRLPKIVGYDCDSRVIASAWRNIQRAGLDGVVHVEARAMEDFRGDSSWASRGLILTNPPYGERLNERSELAGLYRTLGEAVCREVPGWRLGVFTAVPEFGRSIGLRSYRQYRLFNGRLPAQLLLFEVTEDNRRTPVDPDQSGVVRPRITNEARGRDAAQSSAQESEEPWPVGPEAGDYLLPPVRCRYAGVCTGH